MRAVVQNLVQALVANPFDVGLRTRRDAEKALSRLDLAKEMAALIDAGEVENAKAFVLAAGHAQACVAPNDPANVLALTQIPKGLWALLPRGRGAYLRVVMAAGRCHDALSCVLGESERMNRVRRDVWAACFGDSLRHSLDLERVIRDHDVLLFGETGTGKESFARAFQLATPGDMSGGPAPLAAINAAAVPDTLVESALFGHVKGAFTGAHDTRMGRLRTAHGGSFFLDEVGDLPSETQVKLLRVIETNEVFPVGSDSPEPVDVRYIAATHKDLEAMVENREFRRDLYQRLAGNIIRIPPLRDRPDDIIEIGLAFAKQYLDGPSPAGLDAVVEWLHSPAARSYPWPGNVRELQNALRNILLGLDPGLIEVQRRTRVGDVRLPTMVRDATASMQDASDWYLRYVLDHCEGNFTRAARILGIDRSTVRRRINALNRSAPD